MDISYQFRLQMKRRPDTFEFESDCFRMGDRYGRVIFLREYAVYIKDSMVAELCELNL